MAINMINLYGKKREIRYGVENIPSTTIPPFIIEEIVDVGDIYLGSITNGLASTDVGSQFKIKNKNHKVISPSVYDTATGRNLVYLDYYDEVHVGLEEAKREYEKRLEEFKEANGDICKEVMPA